MRNQREQGESRHGKMQRSEGERDVILWIVFQPLVLYSLNPPSSVTGLLYSVVVPLLKVLK